MGFDLYSSHMRQGVNDLPGQEKCSADSYVILPHKSKYVDQQTLKLQVSSSVAALCKRGHGHAECIACLLPCMSRC